MSDKTYIRRSKHDAVNHYMLLRRETAQNKGLSYEALGLLTYLLSKPDDWRVQIGDLQRGKKHGLMKHTAGRDKVRTLLDELCEKGYARRENQRHNEVTGQFEYGDYEIAEMPIFLQPFTENPLTANPSTVKPYTVNPTLHNTEFDIVENNEVQITEDNTFSSENECAFSEVADTDENFEVAENQEDTTAVEETTPDNGERSEEPHTPSSAAPLSPSDSIFAAVAEVWKHNGARAGNIAAIIGGKSKAKGWKQFNFSPVGTPLGVRVFGEWYKLRCSGLHLPEEPQAIQSWYYKMRNDYEANPYQPVFDAFRTQKAVATYTTTYAPEARDDSDSTPAIDGARFNQWQSIYNHMELQFDKPTFDMWLSSAKLLDFDDETQSFVIGVRNQSIQQYLSYRMNRQIDAVLRECLDAPVAIRFEVTA